MMIIIMMMLPLLLQVGPQPLRVCVRVRGVSAHHHTPLLLRHRRSRPLRSRPLLLPGVSMCQRTTPYARHVCVTTMMIIKVDLSGEN